MLLDFGSSDPQTGWSQGVLAIFEHKGSSLDTLLVCIPYGKLCRCEVLPVIMGWIYVVPEPYC